MILALLLLAPLCVAQQVQFLAPTDDSSYTTDGQIAVQIKQTMPFGAADNTFKVRFRCVFFTDLVRVSSLRLTTLSRLCKVLFGGCFDDYQIIPVPELAANVDWTDKTQSLTLSFACNHSWVSSDKYLITIESTTVP